MHGTLSVAFVAQQWTGARGLERVVQAIKPDELIYVGRLLRSGTAPPAGDAAAAEGSSATALGFTAKPGDGVLFASTTPKAELSGLAGELKQLAGQSGIASGSDYSA